MWAVDPLMEECEAGGDDSFEVFLDLSSAAWLVVLGLARFLGREVPHSILKTTQASSNQRSSLHSSDL